MFVCSDDEEVAAALWRARRQRLIGNVRGWLRTSRHPRLAVAALLFLSALVAVLVAYGLGFAGVKAWPARAFFAVIAAWPAFVFLLRALAARECRYFEIGFRSEELIEHDEAAERDLLDLYPSAEKSSWREFRDEFVANLAVTLRHPLVFLILGGATLGLWVVWDLIAQGATLLARMIVDAEHAPAQSSIIKNSETRDWRAEAFGGTAIYFVGLAFAAAMISCVWWYQLGKP